MTTITSKHILSSQGADTPVLSALQLRYPLVIHAELMTHRVFSRNARSSRAVPVARMIEEVMTDPYVPLVWDRNQKGMQGAAGHEAQVSYLDAGSTYNIQVALRTGSNLTPVRVWTDPRTAWLRARDHAVDMARAFADAEYSKQICNRLLAPFLHIDVLVSSVNWSNWESLRIHPAAEPHIKMLAEATKASLAGASIQKLGEGQWHLPYVTEADWTAARERARTRIGTRPWSMSIGEWTSYKQPFYREVEQELRKLSVARCAQISYVPFADDGNATFEKEIAKHDMLAANGHWSPFEHQATPDRFCVGKDEFSTWEHPEFHGNLTGWKQLRKMYPGEYR